MDYKNCKDNLFCFATFNIYIIFEISSESEITGFYFVQQDQT